MEVEHHDGFKYRGIPIRPVHAAMQHWNMRKHGSVKVGVIKTAPRQLNRPNLYSFHSSKHLERVPIHDIQVKLVLSLFPII